MGTICNTSASREATALSLKPVTGSLKKTLKVRVPAVLFVLVGWLTMNRGAVLVAMMAPVVTAVPEQHISYSRRASTGLENKWSVLPEPASCERPIGLHAP